MIVADTTAWIDLLNGEGTPVADRLEALIRDAAPVALTDVVVTELLQGFADEDEAREVERWIRRFPILRMESVDDFVLAAELYRTARAAGVTIRKTLDCLIAAPCVRTDSALLHADRDFDLLASCTALRVA